MIRELEMQEEMATVGQGCMVLTSVAVLGAGVELSACYDGFFSVEVAGQVGPFNQTVSTNDLIDIHNNVSQQLNGDLAKLNHDAPIYFSQQPGNGSDYKYSPVVTFLP